MPNILKARTDIIAGDNTLKTVIDNMLGFAAVLDKDGTLLEVGKPALIMAGLKRKEVIGKKFWNCYWWNYDRNIRKRIKQDIASASSGNQLRHDITALAKKDSRLFVDFMASPVIDSKGKTIMVIASWLDIDETVSAQKREQELALRTEILQEQHDQLVAISAAKDEFISLASHQLRTPATVVKQFIAMIQDGMFGDVPEKLIQPLQKAYDSNERQIRIINDMLYVARFDAGKLELKYGSKDVYTLVSELVCEQAKVFRARQQTLVFTHRKHAKQEIDIDESLMKMALENVIDNASKYSDSDTTATVKVRNFPRTVVIEVSDQGVGIRKRDHDKLFEKFRRIHSPHSIKANGSGLGLYIAKKIVVAHGGDMIVDSKFRKGTTFKIKLPKKLAQ